jgi:hypothetical protein
MMVRSPWQESSSRRLCASLKPIPKLTAFSVRFDQDFKL